MIAERERDFFSYGKVPKPCKPLLLKPIGSQNKKVRKEELVEERDQQKEKVDNRVMEGGDEYDQNTLCTHKENIKVRVIIMPS